jgi:hypothetical protein
MKEANKKIILYAISALLLLTLIFQMITNIKNGFPLSIFWTCYIFMILVPVGILFNKPRIILSQIVIMLVPSILWIIDLTIALITGNPLIGLIGNIFLNGKILINGLIHIYHALIVPAAILALIIMKPKQKETKGYLKISFIQIAILSTMGLIIPALNGINCFPGPEICTNGAMQFSPIYPFAFLAILSTVILLSSLTINYFLKKKF